MASEAVGQRRPNWSSSFVICRKFETLQALLPYSVDVHMVLALSSIYFLSLFRLLNLA